MAMPAPMTERTRTGLTVAEWEQRARAHLDRWQTLIRAVHAKTRQVALTVGLEEAAE